MSLDFKNKIFILLLAILMQSPAGFAYGSQNDDYIPYCITVTFNGDVQSCKGFTWYTNTACASDLLLAEEKTGKLIDFSKARRYQGSSTQLTRYTGRKALKKQVTVHRLDLTDLAPDTTYVYKVGDASRGIWSEAGTFHTATCADCCRFIIAADSQVEDEQDAAACARTLQTALQSVPKADFLIHLGDFVESYSSEGCYENFAQWQHLFAAAQTVFMNTTIMPVAGNHDGSSNVFCSQFYLDKLIPAGANTETGAYYAVNYGKVCFIILNCNEGDQNSLGIISTQQLDWLKKTAALVDRQGATWKILLMHRAIYSFGRHMDQADIIALRAQLAPLFSDLGIDLVLQGHDHVYMRSQALAKSVSGQLVAQTDKGKIVNEDFAGKRLDFTVNPAGTTYIIPNLIGRQFGFRKNAKMLQVYPEAVYQSDDNDEPIFADISIAGNRMVYRAYAYDREGNGQVREIDHYAMQKDNEADGRQVKGSINSPAGERAAPGTQQIRQIVNNSF